MASDPSLKSAPLPASYITYPDSMTRGKPGRGKAERWHCGICGATGKSLAYNEGRFGWAYHLYRLCREVKSS